MGYTPKKTQFLYTKVQDYLYGLIRTNYANAQYRLPSEQEIQELMGVSRITVKNAFLNIEKEGLIYRVQGKGTFISRNINLDTLNRVAVQDADAIQNTTVGLILPDLKSNYILSVLEGISDCLKQNDVNLMVSTHNYSQGIEKKLIKNFLQCNVGALILFPADGEQYNRSILRLSLNKFPLVFIDRNLPGIDASYVHSNDFDASYEATNLLLDRGRRHIGLISPTPQGTFTLETRIKGYETALFEHNVPIQPSLQLSNLVNYAPNWEDRYTAFFTQNPEIDAVFATNFDVGSKVYIVAEKLGIKIPEDLSVIYYDDLLAPVIDLFKVKHSAIRQNTYRIGNTAAQMAMDLMSAKTENQEVKIDCDIVVRDSI